MCLTLPLGHEKGGLDTCLIFTVFFKHMYFLVLSGDSAGLDSKYFERRDYSIPIQSLSSNLLHRGKTIHHLEHSMDNKLQNIQHRQWILVTFDRFRREDQILDIMMISKQQIHLVECLLSNANLEVFLEIKQINYIIKINSVFDWHLDESEDNVIEVSIDFLPFPFFYFQSSLSEQSPP